MSLAPERASRIVRSIFIFTLALLVVSTIGFAAAQTPAFTPREEEPEEFPEAAGREEAFYGCAVRHNLKLVAAQGMSRQRRDDTIDFMIRQHKMPRPARRSVKRFSTISRVRFRRSRRRSAPGRILF